MSVGVLLVPSEPSQVPEWQYCMLYPPVAFVSWSHASVMLVAVWVDTAKFCGALKIGVAVIGAVQADV